MRVCEGPGSALYSTRNRPRWEEAEMLRCIQFMWENSGLGLRITVNDANIQPNKKLGVKYDALLQKRD